MPGEVLEPSAHDPGSSPESRRGRPGPPPRRPGHGRCRGGARRAGPRARARACPPPPTVASTTSPGGTGARSSTTSRPITGRCTNSGTAPPSCVSRACDQPPGQRQPLGCLPESTRLESGRSRGSQPCRPGGWWQARRTSPSIVNCSCARASCPAPLVRSRSPGSSSDSLRLCSPSRSRSDHRRPSQISTREKTPATTTSRSSPAYSRRCCGIAMRPCLSGRDLGGAGEERPGGVELPPASLRGLSTRSATSLNSCAGYTERQPPLPLVT